MRDRAVVFLAMGYACNVIIFCKLCRQKIPISSVSRFGKGFATYNESLVSKFIHLITRGNKINKKQLCVLLMVLFAGVAQAETGDGIYVGIDGVRNSTSFGNEFKEENYSNLGGRVYLGKKVSDAFALEGGFMMSPQHNLKEHEAHYLYESTKLTSAADASLIMTPVQDLSGLKVKVGLALMNINAKQSFQSRNYSAHRNVNITMPGFVAGFAYEMPVTDSISARIGYTRYQQMSSNVKDELKELDHHNDVFSLGIKKQF